MQKREKNCYTLNITNMNY